MNQADATTLVDSLFESLGVFLVRYAQRRVHSSALAEDIVQDAFLSLYRDLRLGKDIHDPKAWTIGAVRNLIRKHARDTARHGEELIATEMFDLVPSQHSAFVEEPSLVLCGLSPREEEVVLLRLQSFKYREIADHLGIGAKSVCTLLARAIRKLQKVAGTAVPEAAAQSQRRKEVRDALQ